MNSLTDEKIRKLVSESELKPPEGYERKIDEILNSLDDLGDGKRKIHFVWRQAVAVFVACLLLGSAGVYATINMSRQHLESMGDTEIDQYRNDVDVADTEHDSYSRSLSEEEEKRLEQLRNAYYTEGRFPEKAIRTVENESQIEDDEICFVTSKSLFFLPERELTDEELLQLIDFYIKRDYSIRTIKENDTQPQVEVLDKDIISLARKYAGSVYDLDFTDATFATEAVETADSVSYYVDITATDGQVFQVVFRNGTDRFDSVQKISSDNKADNIVVDEAFFKENYKNTVEFFDRTADLKNVAAVSINYLYTDEQILKDGVVDYLFIMKDGSAYILNYSCISKEIFGIEYIENLQVHNEWLSENEEIRESMGIRKGEIALDANASFFK